jgi:uncharacterized protein YjbJ (UPF0337 family)
MVNQQTLQGNWNEIKGKVRQRWGQLTNDELESAHGSVDELVGLIQRKTGEARERIESVLEEFSGGAAAGISRMAESAKERAYQASERLREASENVSESMRRGYSEAESMIQERPAQSVLVAFGIGLFAGVLVGLSIGGRD